MTDQQELFSPYAIQPGWDGKVYNEEATGLHYCSPCRVRFLEFRPNHEIHVIYIRRCAGCGRDLLEEVKA